MNEPDRGDIEQRHSSQAEAGGFATSARGVRKNSEFPQSVSCKPRKSTRPSGGPIATTIWTIRMLSACEKMTPHRAAGPLRRVHEFRTAVFQMPSASPASTTGASTSADIWPIYSRAHVARSRRGSTIQKTSPA